MPVRISNADFLCPSWAPHYARGAVSSSSESAARHSNKHRVPPVALNVLFIGCRGVRGELIAVEPERGGLLAKTRRLAGTCDRVLRREGLDGVSSNELPGAER